MGKKLDAVRRELGLAQVAIDNMVNAKSEDELINAWRDVLHRLARVWNKSKDSLKGESRIANCAGVKRIETYLKSDPLIRYLVQARHVDEHHTESITRLAPGRVAIGPIAPGAPMYIRRLSIDRYGAISMDTPTGARLEFRGPITEATAVTNRGRTYEPPTEHDGQLLPDTRLVTLATLGLRFYQTAFDDIATAGWDATDK